jgi:hypothetical protein
MHSSGSQACLPSDVERLLLDVVADGFVVYCCGPKAAPTALVAVYQWQDYVDLVTIRHFERVTTARIPPLHAVGSTCSTPRSWCGHMKAHRTGHCGHYST